MKSEDKTPFWINLNLSNFKGYRHKTAESAEKEAERLIKKCEVKKIYTLKSYLKTEKED